MEDIELVRAADGDFENWIAPRLGPFGGWVGSVVPRGFDAYVRILHPSPARGGEWVTWAEIVRRNGRRMHALAQWEAIAAPAVAAVPAPEAAWAPDIGNLPQHCLHALLDVLEPFTPATKTCFSALWDGYGQLQQLVPYGFTAHGFAEFDRSGPRAHASLQIPQREYLVYRAPLRAAALMGDWPASDWFIPQSPNLFWPQDTSWCVATEIDFDSTVVGGSAELVSAILADPRLESWQVSTGDSLASDGDKINT
ncbi:hypothetical protein [Georgenia subflava]|uniref:Uncharacterized protein n=1 Tax=Georgenia subflava TaxID=1622177 RepID=A0A6N7EKC1_9MICO|nr:hypothetical protein [Georgenia subflava]MPV37005.1 hypothetical protein [Georgenia subflava]